MDEDLERKQSEAERPEDKHLVAGNLERKHPEDKHSEDKHSKDKHVKDNELEDKCS